MDVYRKCSKESYSPFNICEESDQLFVGWNNAKKLLSEAKLKAQSEVLCQNIFKFKFWRESSIRPFASLRSAIFSIIQVDKQLVTFLARVNLRFNSTLHLFELNSGELHLHKQSVYPIMNLAKRLEIPKLVKKCKSIVQGDIVLPSLPSVEKLFSESGTQSENAEALATEAIILVSPEQRQMENVACPLNSHERQEIAELPQVSSTTQMNGNDLPSEELPLVPTENAASQQQQVDIGENIVLQDDSMLVSVDAR